MTAPVKTLTAVGLGAGLAVSGAGTAFAGTDYTVKRGDTLSEIALANHTDWHYLARINHLRDPDLILIGQHLELSAPSTARHRSRTVVQAESSGSYKPRHTSGRSTSHRWSRSTGRVSLSGAWAQVAQCESGGNPRAVNPSGQYLGLFQFDLQTWHSVGGSGSPVNASAAEQLRRAKILYSQRGASPWPVCGRYLR